MPIYSYCCRKCGTEFDKLRPMSQRNEPAECPHCASEEVDRGVEEFGVGGAGLRSCAPSGGGGST
jgi:putative FmdB family regulatory protein